MSRTIAYIVKIFSNYKNWLVGGLLLGISFLHPLLWWAGLFGVWFAFDALKSVTKVRELILGTLILGFIHLGLSILWVWSVYPISGFEIPAYLQILAIFLTWVLSAFAMTLGKFVLTFPVYYWRLKNPGILAILWMFSDIAGAFAFSIMSLGTGGYTNVNFSFGWLGYQFAHHSFFLQFSYVGGVFILTIMYVLLALLLQMLWQSKFSRKGFLVSGLIFVLFFSGLLPIFEKNYDDTLSVAAIETSDNSVLALKGIEHEKYRDDLLNQVRSVVEGGYEYVVLPESADITSFFASSSELLTLLDEHSPGDVVLIDSGWYEHTKKQSYVRARIYDTKTMKVYEIDKSYLVPQGEYMPYLFVFIMNSLGFSEATKTFQSYFDYVPGAKQRGDDWPVYLPGILFCNDSISPWGLQKASQNQSVPFVAHIVSHAWFHEPYTFWYQLDAMLKVNSRFADVTVYQAANMYEAKRY